MTGRVRGVVIWARGEGKEEGREGEDDLGLDIGEEMGAVGCL